MLAIMPGMIATAEKTLAATRRLGKSVRHRINITAAPDALPSRNVSSRTVQLFPGQSVAYFGP
jgi:hypothetical protein